MEVIETVEEHCKHKDCVYRLILDSRLTPFCGYILIEERSRNCKISECDKYRTGIKTIIINPDTMGCEWRVE